MDRRNNFDALRLVAATSVIFSHAFLLSEGREDHEPLKWLTGGQCILGLVGVFLFFTISGYLVSQSFDATGSPLRFLAKRALRIWPGLTACVLLLAFVLGPAVTALPAAQYLGDARVYAFAFWNIVLQVIHNDLPGVTFTGYYGFGTVVDGPLWSLPSEVLMYLMLAALYFAVPQQRWRLAIAFGLVALGMVCIGYDTAASDHPLGNAGWLIGFFAAGMALYQLRGTRVFDGRIALLALAGLIASVPLHRFIQLFPLFGSYLALWLAFTPRLPVIPAARFGDLSYGLYIWGWPVEQTLLYLRGDLRWWQLFLLAYPVTAAIAFLSWHVVEHPALRLKPRARREPVPPTHYTAAAAANMHDSA